jgi:hypothetical protein
MSVDRRDDSERPVRRVKPLHLLAGFLLVGILAVGVLILIPSLPDPTCLSLLARSEGEVAISLPANCARSRNVASDKMVTYLERDPNGRGLIFKEWITCREVPAGGFAFMDDSHWLPSYVPGTYQFRRTVIIVSYPYAGPIPKGSPVVAEVCLMPWRKYILQIAGQCSGKYSVWR